jgi:hypothetical protein
MVTSLYQSNRHRRDRTRGIVSYRISLVVAVPVLAETFVREFSDERAEHGAPQLGARRPRSQA